MGTWSVSKDGDVLLREAPQLLSGEFRHLAGFLARLAEIDVHRHYVAAGYSSMRDYCMKGLRLTEQAAQKRLGAARAAREFPALFDAIAEGRLCLSAVVLLAPKLRAANAAELIAAASGKSRFEIERLLADRAPKRDVPGAVQAIPLRSGATIPGDSPAADGSTIPGDSSNGEGGPTIPGDSSTSFGMNGPTIPGDSSRPRVSPLGLQRYALQVTINEEEYEALRYAQSLMRHQHPSGDLSRIVGRAIRALVERLEKKKLGAGSRPAGSRRSSGSSRHIPTAVRRAVWERDEGRCTFESSSGHRCESRDFVEFDHITPVAQGGEATVHNLRLRCRAHNQHAAEQAFGAEFMARKREDARRHKEAVRLRREETQRIRAAAERLRAEAALAFEKERAEARAAKERAAALAAKADELIPTFRSLGCNLAEAHDTAIRCCEELPDGSLEERIRLALRWFGQRAMARSAPWISR